MSSGPSHILGRQAQGAAMVAWWAGRVDAALSVRREEGREAPPAFFSAHEKNGATSGRPAPTDMLGGVGTTQVMCWARKGPPYMH